MTNKIVIIGATGDVGCPTVTSLVRLVDPSTVCVATRDPECVEARTFQSLGVNVVHGDLNSVESAQAAFAGAWTVYIIFPGVENRGMLAVNGIKAAKAAGVRHIVLQSVTLADVLTTSFGRQFHQGEVAVKKCGVPYTIIRLPLFTENLLLEADTIRHKGKLYGTVNPDVNFSTVSTCDVNICGPMYNKKELAQAFTSALGKTVEYEQVSYDNMRKCFLEKGMPEWLVCGMLEIFRAMDAGAFGFADDDFLCLTGKEPHSVQQWVEANKAAFA